MKTTSFQSQNEIRLEFTHAMSKMYRQEVPQYEALLSLAQTENDKVITKHPLSLKQTELLHLEHHGAIRVGSPHELSNIRRLFKVMGMRPVDYYDLSVAGIPVHSTAFRALNRMDIEKSPFRIFCSLLRLDLIEDISLRKKAKKILSKRQVFPKQLLALIDLSEKQGGLAANEAAIFIDNALEVFRWHKNAAVDQSTYEELKATHGLVADIVSFKGPHINHLTPKVLDIDACQQQFIKKNIRAKTYVEGPPKRHCPILLRQTSFIAIAEDVIFMDGEQGKHTARFGEVEQRGIALTPKGRKLYDELLLQARNDDSSLDYPGRLEKAFNTFPDTYKELHLQGLAYFYYKATSKKISNGLTVPIDLNELIEQGQLEICPIIYQDFLPVSAAGIFNSNLSEDAENNNVHAPNDKKNREYFEKDLGVPVILSFKLYEAEQKHSLNEALKALGV